MCGKLNFRGKDLRPGDVLPIFKQKFKWSGFARRESKQDWLKKKWSVALIPVASFVEHEKRIAVSENQKLAIMLNKTTRQFRVVTRHATEAESNLIDHHRIPVFIRDKEIVHFA